LPQCADTTESCLNATIVQGRFSISDLTKLIRSLQEGSRC
jgi:hypothetical protein